jgi:hypothetical protein
MVVRIIDTMSHPRFSTYLYATGQNRDRALLLYQWNAKLGASFHTPIQAAEVALRNRVNHALVAEFGNDWWTAARFCGLIDRERTADLKTVKTRIRRKQLTLETDQIVAGLSFGFWVGMLQPKYNPTIWGTHLRTAFSHLPAQRDRHSLFKRGGEIAGLRNRISHHEPLLKADAMRHYGEILEFLRWLCPKTADWVRPQCEIAKIVRQKP